MDENDLKTEDEKEDEAEANKLLKVGGAVLGGTALAGVVKTILDNKDLSPVIADAIKEHKKLIIGGGLILGALYILKDKKIKFKIKDGDREIELQTE